MVLWPTVTVVGFLLLTALVVALGMQSTARYEAEKRAAAPPRARNTVADTARAAATVTASL
jgi:hypothetical protein